MFPVSNSFLLLLVRHLLLVVRHLFLIANIVTTSKALVTRSDALVLIAFRHLQDVSVCFKEASAVCTCTSIYHVHSCDKVLPATSIYILGVELELSEASS